MHKKIYGESSSESDYDEFNFNKKSSTPVSWFAFSRPAVF